MENSPVKYRVGILGFEPKAEESKSRSEGTEGVDRPEIEGGGRRVGGESNVGVDPHGGVDERELDVI